MSEDKKWDPSQDSMMQTMGYVRMIELDQAVGRAVVEFEAKVNQCHSGNVVQGGFVTGWIDNAMATAAMNVNMDMRPLGAGYMEGMVEGGLQQEFGLKKLVQI